MECGGDSMEVKFLGLCSLDDTGPNGTSEIITCSSMDEGISPIDDKPPRNGVQTQARHDCGRSRT